MPRFFVDAEMLAGGSCALSGEQAAHMKVLRLRVGDPVTLCDGAGLECAGVITKITPEKVLLELGAVQKSQSEPGVLVSVYMAYAKGDKLEHVIQKATELGAAEIAAFPSSRCVAKLDGKTLNKKLPRWQKIAAAAAEQSGRGRIPRVLALPSYEEAVKRAAQADKPLFFYENEREQTLSEALGGRFSAVSLMTGPEGGFSEEEAQAAIDAGMLCCTLGRRILRCETAPLCALSAVMFAAGEY